MRYCIEAFEFRFRNLYIAEHFAKRNFKVRIAHTGKALSDPLGKTVSVMFEGEIPRDIDRDVLMYHIINEVIDPEAYALHYGRIKEVRMGFSYYRIYHEFKVNPKPANSKQNLENKHVSYGK